jgi:hypothetical protein
MVACLYNMSSGIQQPQLNFYSDGVLCCLFFWCLMMSRNLALTLNLSGLGLGFNNNSMTSFIASLSMLYKTRKVHGNNKVPTFGPPPVGLKNYIESD